MATSSFNRKFTLKTKKAAKTLLALMENPKPVQLSQRDEAAERDKGLALMSDLLKKKASIE